MKFLLLPISVFLLDYSIKERIDKKKELNKKEELLHGKFLLRKYYNNGAAFNFLDRRPVLVKLVNIALFLFLCIIYVLLFHKKSSPGLKAASGLMLGGAASNLYDRCKKKHVVDYLSLNVKSDKIRGIIFNLSDLFIFLGAILGVFFASREH